MGVKTGQNFEDFIEFVEITGNKGLKVIWDRQNEEKLYALNENVLYQQIKRKRKSISRLLLRSEVGVIGINLLVAIILVFAAYLNNSGPDEYLLASIFLAYAVFGIVLRQKRVQTDADVSFDRNIMGELDKAIWQINYLVKHSHQQIRWYMLPLTAIIAGKLLYDGLPLAALAVILVMGGAGVGTQWWQIYKKYLPQKESLVLLRTTLISTGAKP